MSTNTNNQSDDNKTNAANDPNNAADLIRHKLDSIYEEEPDASDDLTESEHISTRSVHQQYMLELSNSGKDLAAIQTEWHNYYQNLPDKQKHQVWQEFYSSQPTLAAHPVVEDNPTQISKLKEQAANPHKKRKKLTDARSAEDIKSAIKDKVSAGGKLEAKHHLQSLLFGLSMGGLVLLVFLFGFFNEVILAPFIQPSRAAADTPLIIGNSSVAPTSTPEVIIPKINVEIPVNYTENSTNENAIENDLLSGVVHYPTTSLPGQNGNTAFFGHSSNNIFNKGKYKFAFVLLHNLVNGDTFYLTYNQKVYIYKVISHNVVDPSDISVLNPVVGQTATATLITCDPPGTSLHRLIVVGQQISPDPTSNTASTASAIAGTANPSNSSSSLPSDGPTLWAKFIRTVIGKIVVLLVLIGAAIFFGRKFWRPLLQKYRT